VNEHRIIEQVDRMVASGRITEEEAARLRAAPSDASFEEVVAGIRARHAQVHIDAAVAEGRMNQAEADELLNRLRSGEHSKELRSRIKGTN